MCAAKARCLGKACNIQRKHILFEIPKGRRITRTSIKNRWTSESRIEVRLGYEFSSIWVGLGNQVGSENRRQIVQKRYDRIKVHLGCSRSWFEKAFGMDFGRFSIPKWKQIRVKNLSKAMCAAKARCLGKPAISNKNTYFLKFRRVEESHEHRWKIDEQVNPESECVLVTVSYTHLTLPTIYSV